MICALDRVEAHVAARKLAAVAEFIRRRPARDDDPQDSARSRAQDPGKGSPRSATQVPAKAASKDQGKGGADKSAPQGHAEDPGKAAPQGAGKGGPEKGAAQDPAKDGGTGTVAGGMPSQGWDEFAVRELAWALAESQDAAADLMAIAYQLEGQLPGTRAALRDGRIRLSKATAIARATQFLNEKEAATAEDMVLGRAGQLTPPGLRAAIGRAVMEVAPKKARKRREEAAKQTRVERWAEHSGNAGLAGRELPSAQVLAADQRITAWARELRAAGLDGDMDVLRARAYMDILLGMDSRLAAGGAAGAGCSADDGEPDPFGPVRNPFGPPAGPAGGGGSGLFGPPVPAGAAVLPPGFCGSINLTVPLVTALGLADRPGQAGTIGPIDPWLARDLLRSAMPANPRTTWCVTVTDEDGHAIGHGCARPEPRRANVAGRAAPEASGPGPAGRSRPARPGKLLPGRPGLVEPGNPGAPEHEDG